MALLATVIPISGSVLMVTAGPFLAVWLRGSGAAGWVAFTIGYVVLAALMIAPTYSTSIVAGWAFGFVPGFAAMMIGTVVGAVLCYAMARRLAAERVAEVFGRHAKWEIVRQALVEERSIKTLWIVFLMRLSPVLPFGTTNVLMATTGVPLPIFALGTALGLMPRVALIALAAAGADTLDFDSAESWWLLALGLLATGVCIFALAMIGRRALRSATMNRSSPPDSV